MCRNFIDNIKIKLNPGKCPTCGCREVMTITHSDTIPTSYVKETEICCANCKRIKAIYSYGHALFENWKNPFINKYYRFKLFNRHKIKKTLDKTKSTEIDVDLDDLPF